MLSKELVARISPVGDHETHLTVRLCPEGMTSSSRNTVSDPPEIPEESFLYEYKRTSLSVEQEANNDFLGFQAKFQTVSAWPCRSASFRSVCGWAGIRGG